MTSPVSNLSLPLFLSFEIRLYRAWLKRDLLSCSYSYQNQIFHILLLFILYFIHTQLHLFRKSLKSICTLYYELLFNINIFFLTINIYTIWTWISLIAFVILAREEIEYSLIYLYWGIHPSLIWDLTKTKPIKARRQSAMSMRPCHLTCSNNYRRCHMSSIGARAVQCKLRNTIYILTILHR